MISDRNAVSTLIFTEPISYSLAGILVFTDKIIDKETANRIRREIGMTQVAQIFEEEKRLAVAVVEEEKRQALEALEKKF